MALVLVVDDELAIAELVRTILEDKGYHVVTAHNGRDALATLSQAAPDLVLSDLMMPIMDGFGLCHAMHADPRYSHIPFVLMSARSQPPAGIDCAHAAFLAKPFEPQSLLDLLARFIPAPG